MEKRVLVVFVKTRLPYILVPTNYPRPQALIHLRRRASRRTIRLELPPESKFPCVVHRRRVVELAAKFAGKEFRWPRTIAQVNVTPGQRLYVAMAAAGEDEKERRERDALRSRRDRGGTVAATSPDELDGGNSLMLPFSMRAPPPAMKTRGRV
jgi:hypothetical protein